MDLTIKKIERIWVQLPYRETPAKHMVREIPQWKLSEICKVHLACGVVGIGETNPYYGPAKVTDETVAKATGKNPFDIMWDDNYGMGLQMAIFDAIGKALEIPVYKLLGEKVRDRAMVGWWAIDMTPEDWLKECKEALSQGYTNFKTKARPWYDLNEQIALLSKELPPWFEIDLDFNGTLMNTNHAKLVLMKIEKYPQVAIYETPIPHHDAVGNRHLRDMTRVPIAMHMGTPPILTSLQEDLCDGYVVTGGATEVLKKGIVAAEAEKVFWLQHVGTDIAATWSTHLAAVLTHARWPAINCHQLHEYKTVKNPMKIMNGSTPIPEGPGLGIELDEDVIERFRIDPIPKPYPTPGMLIAIRWPSGSSSYYSHCKQYLEDFRKGQYPIFAEGINLEQIYDDGSKEWRELQAKAQTEAVHMEKPIF